MNKWIIALILTAPTPISAAYAAREPRSITPVIFRNILTAPPFPKPSTPVPGAARRQYLLELDGARRDGLWIDIHKLQQPLPPPNKNAAAEYLQFANAQGSANVKADKELIKDFLREGPHGDSEVSAVRSALRRQHILLALAHAAASKPSCVVEHQWATGDPTSIKQPELISMWWSARFITAESIVFAHDGKPRQAIENQKLCFRIASQAASEPIMISYLVAVAAQAYGIDGLDRILAISSHDQSIAKSIKGVIQTEFQPISPLYALKGETATYARLMEYTHQMGPAFFAKTEPQAPGTTTIQPKTKADFDLWLDMNARRTIQELRELAKNAALPSVSIYHSIDEQTTHLAAPRIEDYALAQALIPVFARSISRRYVMTARARATETKANLLIWSAKHGQLPTTLAQAVEKLPIDPYSGKPFQYARTANGFILWSLGQSGNNDPQRQNAAKDETAVVVRYP